MKEDPNDVRLNIERERVLSYIRNCCDGVEYQFDEAVRLLRRYEADILSDGQDGRLAPEGVTIEDTIIPILLSEDYDSYFTINISEIGSITFPILAMNLCLYLRASNSIVNLVWRHGSPTTIYCRPNTGFNQDADTEFGSIGNENTPYKWPCNWFLQLLIQQKFPQEISQYIAIMSRLIRRPRLSQKEEQYITDQYYEQFERIIEPFMRIQEPLNNPLRVSIFDMYGRIDKINYPETILMSRPGLIRDGEPYLMPFRQRLQDERGRIVENRNLEIRRNLRRLAFAAIENARRDYELELEQAETFEERQLIFTNYQNKKFMVYLYLSGQTHDQDDIDMFRDGNYWMDDVLEEFTEKARELYADAANEEGVDNGVMYELIIDRFLTETEDPLVHGYAYGPEDGNIIDLGPIDDDRSRHCLDVYDANVFIAAIGPQEYHEQLAEYEIARLREALDNLKELDRPDPWSAVNIRSYWDNAQVIQNAQRRYAELTRINIHDYFVQRNIMSVNLILRWRQYDLAMRLIEEANALIDRLAPRAAAVPAIAPVRRRLFDEDD